MRTPPALALGAVVAVVLVIAGVALLGDGEKAGRPDPESSTGSAPLTGAECERVIPTSALESFGWQVAAATVEAGDRRCVRGTDQGTVTVDDSAVVAGAEELAEEAGRVFEEQCTSLGADVVRDPAWLGTEDPSCAVTTLNDGRGQAELHLLAGGSRVIRIHVALREPVTRDALREGLALVAGSAGAIS